MQYCDAVAYGVINKLALLIPTISLPVCMADWLRSMLLDQQIYLEGLKSWPQIHISA